VVKRERISPWPFIGMAGLACTFFLNAASGLVAPWWGVTLLLFKWLVLLMAGFRLWTPRPKAVLALPVVDFVLWIGVVTAGGLWWGWTA
jgi:hypothetical protein